LIALYLLNEPTNMMHQTLEQSWLTNILVISVIIQVTAAIIASSQIKEIKDGYQIAWILMCIGLFLMVERRVAPLWRLLEHGEISSIIDAYFGLVVSILLLIGNYGIRELFKKIALQQAKLVELANKDELTGLDNRRCILEKVKSEMNRSLRIKCNFSLLMIDIDHFKNVNDTFGHVAGDSALRQISEITAKALRNIDAVGRIGGEEFLVVLPDTNSKDALTTADRLRMAIANHDFHLGNQPTLITVSIGVFSHILERKTDVDILLETLDKALYKAKNNGRNCIEI
jgi:diguanylate cyclase (GGDEF)-like protein